MDKPGIPLFTLFGFKVSLDLSWFFLAILVTWTLAAGYFPMHYPDLKVNTYWIMGAFGTVGLFFSIILHELSHSLVGRHYDLPIAGIRLFIFGGIAEMHDEPSSPKAEFLMSVAGPAMSILLGLIFTFLARQGKILDWPRPVVGVIGYLGIINFILAIFNLLPGFPLDGGRILRSILWWWKNDLRKATKIASSIGASIGYALMFLGIFSIIMRNFIGGIWLIFIGFFLQRIAKLSLQQLIIKQTFKGVPIRKFIKNKPISVDLNLTVSELINDYFYNYYHKLYPVTDQHDCIGSVSLNKIKELSRDLWPTTRVRDIMDPLSEETILSANTEIADALQKMNQQQKSRYLVMENNNIIGVITLKDLIDIISTISNLEQ